MYETCYVAVGVIGVIILFPIGKIRYAHKGAPCTVETIDEDTVRVIFDEPQRAITPGQAVVFYQDDYVLGGGVIQKRL